MAIIHVSDTDFEEKVINSRKLVLVDFSAEWCMPCKMMAPVFESVSDSVDNVVFAKADVDNCPGISSKYSILSVPTLILFENGKVKNQISGAMQKADLEKWIKDNS
ncbi:MAG: thioredoxin [Candidatus Aureabacteria bacterium]|nr:thioredoxin [Candidatus Auribacterota bacterium]